MAMCSNNSSAKLMVMNQDTKHLPLDLFVNILVGLPVESLCCIRCVSKAMLDMVDSHFFVTLHTRSLVTSSDHVPQLMYLTRFSKRQKFNTPRGYVELVALKYDGDTTLTTGKHALTLCTPKRYDLQQFKVDFVFYNLFCFRDVQDSLYGHCFLVDPLRGEILRLPPRDIPDTDFKFFCGDCYGMGFDSLNGTYKILRVSIFSRGTFAEVFMVAHVFELGTSSWRDIPSVPPNHSFLIKCVSAYGDMHWMTIDISEGTCHIVSFDFKKEEFFSSPHPKLQRWDHSHLFSGLHLVTLRGSLATVDTCLSTAVTMNVEMWVLKDYDKKIWTRDYTISIEMVGLRPNLLSNDIICGEWEHGIFFKHLGEDGNFLFLDLKRRSMKVVTYGTGNNSDIYSYTKSLISLKDYDKSIRVETSRFVEVEVEDFSV